MRLASLSRHGRSDEARWFPDTAGSPGRWIIATCDRVNRKNIPLTHEFLALMLGVRRTGVTLALHLLEGQGLILHDRQYIEGRQRASADVKDLAEDHLARIERKIAGKRVSRLGTLWWPSYFVGGYAVHGSDSVPTYPASHGCVRIPRYLEQKFFYRNPVGMPLFVHE